MTSAERYRRDTNNPGFYVIHRSSGLATPEPGKIIDPSEIAGKSITCIKQVYLPKTVDEALSICKQLGEHFAPAIKWNMVDEVLEEMRKLNRTKEEPQAGHGKNKYENFIRVPEWPESADHLATVQTIDQGTESNKAHVHKAGTEGMLVLEGSLQPTFTSSPEVNEGISAILMPGSSIVVAPGQYHRVENAGAGGVRTLILRFPHAGASAA